MVFLGVYYTLLDFGGVGAGGYTLTTLQLREGSKHGQHEFARRRVGINALLVTDEGNALVGESVDDIQQLNINQLPLFVMLSRNLIFKSKKTKKRVPRGIGTPKTSDLLKTVY